MSYREKSSNSLDGLLQKTNIFGKHSTPSKWETQFNVNKSEGDLMTATKFFIYGSWTQGMVHFSKIENHIESLEQATIKGSAYRAKVGFPLITQQGDTDIPGQLVILQGSDVFMALLDEYFGYNPLVEEKSLHFKKSTIAQTNNGPVDCMTYFLNPSKLPPHATLIVDGNWQKSLQEKPDLSTTLSERQRTYIKKLGNSTGREIVPIDLPLYRELMNLELIVDKGRRLALSKLGQEVFKHLV